MFIYIIIYWVYFIPDLWIELWGEDFFLEFFFIINFPFSLKQELNMYLFKI